MSLKVVLFTRLGRPSGAQMAWRLIQAGYAPLDVIVEKRGRMMAKKKKSIFALFFELGFDFFWKRLWEVIHIRSHFYRRKFLKFWFKDPVYLSIEELALDFPLQLHEVEDHNGPEVKELLQRISPDIGILTNTRRIKKEILEIPRHGFFNLHLSALPEYAGLDSIFWALYHGEKEIGVTVHFAAEEIDRGDMVMQKKIPVCDFDDENTLYTKALWLGTFLTMKALKQLEEGKLTRIPQSGAKPSYFSWPSAQDRALFKERAKDKQKNRESKKEGVRVLHLITRMIRGGAQENTLATCKGLRDKGYDVVLATGPTWGNEGEIISKAMLEGVPVLIIRELIRELDPVKDPIVFVKLLALLAKSKYAIIHTHTSKIGFLGRLAAYLRRIPVVIHTPHGHVFHSYFSPWKERLFLFMERRAARCCDRLIALTESEQREHLALYVGRPDQWDIIPSGVNERYFYPVSCERKLEIRVSLGIPLERKIVGFIGRLANVKGAAYLIEAIPQILQSYPETHFLIVGDGQDKNSLEKRIQQLGIKGAVTFAGHQPSVAEFLDLMDILVVPSLNEGMGRVIVEGGFLAKPVIGTRVGGIPDLIEDEVTGLLVERRQSGQIAGAVIRLLNDTSLAVQLGENLQGKVLAGFTEKHMVEKIDSLYQQLLTRKGIRFQEVQRGERIIEETAVLGHRASS